MTLRDESIVEMSGKQLKNVPSGRKLSYGDMRRIAKQISIPIFASDCSIWQGYVSSSYRSGKGNYINFYFKGKKVSLHRLLYENFVENINKNECVRFTCGNKGKCCCVSHLKKEQINIKDECSLVKYKDAECISEDSLQIEFD